jgi:hypothetical protein
MAEQQMQSSRMYGNQLQNFLSVLSGGDKLMKQLKDNVLERLYYRRMELATEGDEKDKANRLQFDKDTRDAYERIELGKQREWKSAQDKALAAQNAALSEQKRQYTDFMKYLKELQTPKPPVVETTTATDLTNSMIKPLRSVFVGNWTEERKRREDPSRTSYVKTADQVRAEDSNWYSGLNPMPSLMTLWKSTVGEYDTDVDALERMKKRNMSGVESTFKAR